MAVSVWVSHRASWHLGTQRSPSKKTYFMNECMNEEKLLMRKSGQPSLIGSSSASKHFLSLSFGFLLKKDEKLPELSGGSLFLRID